MGLVDMLRRCTLAAIVVSVATAAMAAHACRRAGGRGRDQPDRSERAPVHRRDGRARRRPGCARSCAGTSSSRTARAAGTRPRSRACEQYTSIAQFRGIKVVAVVLGAPQWANGSTDPYVPPRDPADFGRFLGSLAARERGKVAAWEIWNEPDEKDFWHGQVGAGALRAAAHRRAHGDQRGRPARPWCSPAPRPATTTRSSKASTPPAPAGRSTASPCTPTRPASSRRPTATTARPTAASGASASSGSARCTTCSSSTGTATARSS